MNQKPGLKEIRTRIAGLKRRKRFVPWRESRRLADELDEILYDIQMCGLGPSSGTELIAAFFETDTAVLGTCDDSSGYVGDVYRLHAQEVFLGFAVKCEDKSGLANLVHELNYKDDFGVRDTLIHCAGDYLPETEIRSMVTRLQELARSESGRRDKQHWLYHVESLARQIGDAPLFEKTRKAAWGRTPTAACVDIAEVYFESGDAETALSWLERIPTDETFQEDERDDLLLKVHGRLEDRASQADVAWRVFRRRRCVVTLDQLVSVLGESQRNVVIEREVAVILSGSRLSYSDAAFLLEIGRVNDAEAYLLEHYDELDGDYYDHLLPMAEVFEATAHALAATALYRALLESILKKARSKIYRYAVRYLKKLDLLATQITDWGPIDDHGDYFEFLQTKHGRKTSFWSKYEKARF